MSFKLQKIDPCSDRIFQQGITANVLHAYHYICLNFAHAEDEIYLVGFSRGAYTAYILASFISRVGLLKNSGLMHMNTLYTLWIWEQGRHLPSRQDELRADLPLAGMPKGGFIANFGKLVPEEIVAQGWDLIDAIIDSIHTRIITDVKIEACALWDTVSALAIPAVRGFEPRRYTKYEFVDNRIPNRIKNIFHALALNEQRRDFTPLLFTSPPDGTNLMQTWFLGCHSDIGGGNKDIALSNISLAWMIAQLETNTGLTFNRAWEQLAPSFYTEKIIRILVAGCETDKSKSLFNRSTSEAKQKEIAEVDNMRFRQGKIGETYKDFYKASGKRARTMELYHRATLRLHAPTTRTMWYIRRKLLLKKISDWSKSLWPSTESLTENPNVSDNRHELNQNVATTKDREPELAKKPKIHFTVRLMLAHKYREAKCPALSGFEPVFDEPSKIYTWSDYFAREIASGRLEDYDFGEETILRGMVLEEKPSRTELALLRTWFKGEENAMVEEWNPTTEHIRRNDDGVLLIASSVNEYLENCMTLARFLEPLVEEYAMQLGHKTWAESETRYQRELLELKYRREYTCIRMENPGLEEKEYRTRAFRNLAQKRKQANTGSAPQELDKISTTISEPSEAQDGCQRDPEDALVQDLELFEEEDVISSPAARYG